MGKSNNDIGSWIIGIVVASNIIYGVISYVTASPETIRQNALNWQRGQDDAASLSEAFYQTGYEQGYAYHFGKQDWGGYTATGAILAVIFLFSFAIFGGLFSYIRDKIEDYRIDKYGFESPHETIEEFNIKNCEAELKKVDEVGAFEAEKLIELYKAELELENLRSKTAAV